MPDFQGNADGGMGSGGASEVVDTSVDTGAQGGGESYDYSGAASRVEGAIAAEFEENSVGQVANPDGEFEEPAFDGGSDGPEGATPGNEEGDVFDEPELSPAERALKALQESDPDGFAAIQERIARGDAFEAERQRAAHDAEVQRRMAEGDVFADVDPAVGAAFVKEFQNNDLKEYYATMGAYVPKMAEGIAGDVLGQAAEVVKAKILREVQAGNDVSAASVGDFIREAVKDVLPGLREAILQDFDTLATGFNELSVKASKVAHKATLQGIKNSERVSEVTAAFDQKVKDAERGLGRQFTPAERDRAFKRFGVFMASDPSMSYQEAMDEVFSPHIEGMKTGKEQGRREATQRNTRLGHENAHRGGRKPSQKGGMAQMLKDGMSIEDILEKYA